MVTSVPSARYICDDLSHHQPTYVFPRGDECLLGGTVDDRDWRTEEDLAIRESILERCRALEPALIDSRFLRSIVGLRPGRSAVRLEMEHLDAGPSDDGPWTLHNYGHGGAGFTVAWGCAEEVLALVEQRSAADGLE